MAEDDPYNRNAKDEDNDDLAHDRTDMAEDRTVMAVERTFAGWMRTSFGAIGIGLGFNALFDAVQPWWVARAIATVFIVLAAALAVVAQHRARKALGRMSGHAVDRPDAPHLRYIAWSVCAGALTLILAIWFLLDAVSSGGSGSGSG